MKKSVKYFVLALSVVNTSTVLPITESTANLLTFGTAAAGAGCTYYTYNNSNNPSNAQSDAIGVGIGSVAATGLMYFITSFITPSGRFGRAKTKLERIRNNPLSLQSFNEEKKLMDMVQETYLESDYPLVDVFNDMNKLFADCRSAIDLLNAAKIDSNGHGNFIQNCDQLITEAKDMLLNLASAIKVVKTNKDFQEQLKLYKKEQLAKQQIAAMNSQANAQWSQANAHWHKNRK